MGTIIATTKYNYLDYCKYTSILQQFHQIKYFYNMFTFN